MFKYLLYFKIFKNILFENKSKVRLGENLKKYQLE